VRLALLSFVLILGCHDGGDDSTFEAGTVDAAPDVDRSVCTVSIDQYCGVKACPIDVDAAVAQLCASDGVVSACGDVVASVSIDFGSGYAFDDGGLTTIFSYNNGKTTCIAGTIGSDVSNIGCAFTTNACITDAASE